MYPPSNSICLVFGALGFFSLVIPFDWKCSTLWHCVVWPDTALRINDSNVCCHTTCRSSSARGQEKKLHLNNTRDRFNALDDKWKSILTNVNFYAQPHCLRHLMCSNKCKHHVRNLCRNHTTTSQMIPIYLQFLYQCLNDARQTLFFDPM